MINSIKPKIAVSSLPSSGWWPNGITAYEDNDMMTNGAYPNQTLLKEEHLSLIKTLNRYSLDIMEIPFKQELETHEKYDFVFMRDHFLCNTNKDIVMCNMKLSERMNEGEFVISNLENTGYNISFLDEDCIAEGGEFFYLPKENMLLAGQGRNNLKGAEQMAEKLKVSNLFTVSSSGYHLDTAISPIFNNNNDCIGIICAKEVFNNNEINDLRNICISNQWELIEIEHLNINSSLRFRTAMNGLTLPGLFIGSKKLNQKPISEFALSNNIIFDATEVSQFNLSGGSVHCLTNELF
jgi:N-dimethylarginine dimethylaminohydrolase